MACEPGVGVPKVGRGATDDIGDIAMAWSMALKSRQGCFPSGVARAAGAEILMNAGCIPYEDVLVHTLYCACNCHTGPEGFSADGSIDAAATASWWLLACFTIMALLGDASV